MPTQSDIVELLRGNETFADAPESVLIELASRAEEQAVEAGQTLIRQGVKCGQVYVVLDGEFAVYINEEETPVARLGRGRIFGEIGAVSGIDATATVRSLSAGTVLGIPDKALHGAMRHAPKLAESVLRSLSRYLGSR